MRRYADPSRCPGCGSTLSPGVTRCPGCHLDLSGALAAELFTTLVHADSLLTRMRTRSDAPAPVPVPAAPAVPPVSPPVGPPATAPAVVRGSSVPKILLGLGAVCLLVAALVFLAVTWSQMGVGGRTATLVGFTLTTGLLTAWVARRGLRGAVEALGVVTLGLVVLDLYGARTAGWLGDPTEAGMSILVGAVLVVAGLAAVLALSRTEAAGFASGELAVALGALLLSVGITSQGTGAVAVRQLFALCLVLALTAAMWALVRPGSAVFRVAAWSLVPVLLLDWAALVVMGLDDIGPTPTMSSAWLHLEAWPLVAAGLVALLVAVPRQVPLLVRVSSAAAGLAPIAFAAAVPAVDESTTVVMLAVVAVSLAVVALMVAAPSPWGATGLAVGAFCVLALAIETLTLLGFATDRYAVAASAAWSGSTGGRLPEAELLDSGAPWLLPLCVLVLVALLWATVRLVEEGRRITARTVLGGAGLALTAALVATLLLYPVPVWTVLLTLVVLTSVLAWWALGRDSIPAAVAGGATLSAAVILSWYDDQLTAMTAFVALLLSAVMHLRARREVVATLAGAAVAMLLAGLVWTIGAIADVAGSSVGLVGLLLLAALALGRHLVPVGLRTPGVHAVLELAAAGAGLVLVAAALDTVPEADLSTWLAVYLTVAGAAAVLLALVRPDRRKVAWLGGLLLAAATWVRLADIGVEAPEPYTLPSALALVAVGLVRLHRDRSVGTARTLGPGLVLALVPSLLWVVAYPGEVRSLLLGLACLALVVGGAQLRWVAPLVLGAVVGLVVVLVEAGPHIGSAVPRWALIGAAGALLITLGVTWEQRLRDARLVATYVRGLR